jgi:NAD(P)-dependent dehydrogenase (short-subunit alcohol dehydrogenase family)
MARKAGFDFSEKIILITGASEGIGAATAQLFAEHGADVAIAARRADRVARRAAAIAAATGRRCLPVTADVTDPTQVKNMVDRTLQEFGRIDVLVNNAGGSVRATMKKLTPEIWQRGRALNLDSAAYCTMEVGKHFLDRSKGAIVNVSSVAGLHGTMGEVPYSAGKAGIQMLTRVSAAEWGPHGVRINCVAPGMTVTEKVQRSFEAGIYRQEVTCAKFPLRRAGTCEEVAYAILFLASDYASYITGQTLAVDGGPAISGFTE